MSAMFSAYDIIEQVKKADASIKCLRNFIFDLTYDKRVSDPEFDNLFHKVIDAVEYTAFFDGPEGETWPDHKADKKEYYEVVSRYNPEFTKLRNTPGSLL